jgi:CubicO group peptidase (beta-lactamase class C family)
VAQAQSVLACGGTVCGKRFLSTEGAVRALAQRSDGIDLVFGSPVRFATGFALSVGETRFGKGRSCFWAGSGRSLIVIDSEERMAIANVMNRTVGAPFGDPRNVAIVEAAHGSLEP